MRKCATGKQNNIVAGECIFWMKYQKLRGVKMLRRIDSFIGRHMGVKRWIAVYLAVFIGGGVLVQHGWWGFLGAPMLVIGTLGVWGNIWRLR